MQNPIDVDARISQQHLIVRLPMSQIVSLFVAVGMLLAGFYLTNDRLSNKVDMLGISLGKLAEVLDRVQQQQFDQEARLRVLESRRD